MIQDLCLWNSIPNSKPPGTEFALLPKKLVAAASRILNPSSGYDLDANLELGLLTLGLQLHKSCNQFYSCLPSMSIFWLWPWSFRSSNLASWFDPILRFNANQCLGAARPVDHQNTWEGTHRSSEPPQRHQELQSISISTRKWSIC